MAAVDMAAVDMAAVDMAAVDMAATVPRVHISHTDFSRFSNLTRGFERTGKGATCTGRLLRPCSLQKKVSPRAGHPSTKLLSCGGGGRGGYSASCGRSVYHLHPLLVVLRIFLAQVTDLDKELHLHWQATVFVQSSRYSQLKSRLPVDKASELRRRWTWRLQCLLGRSMHQ